MRALTILLVAGLATPALAQVKGAEGQLFRPATAPPTDYFTVRGTSLLPPLTPVAGAYLHYSNRPVVFDDGVDDRSLLGSLWTLDAYAAMGIIDRLQVGVGLPVHLYAGGDAVAAVQGELDRAGLGDLRLNGRYGLGDVPFVEGLRAATLLDLTVPFGAAGDYLGAGNVTLHPALALEYELDGRVRLGTNLGWLLRQEMEFEGVKHGHQFTWAVAGGYALDDQLEVIAELFGRVNADWAVDASAATTPAELDVGARYTPWPGHHLNGLVGVGVNQGVGAPTARVLLGYTWEGPSYSDRDGDGIDDLSDACPDEPEDRDGFEASDGCPDQDNDKDGILEPV
ncbi:MAG: transporter, partial [Myxococcales bacterium]|nr:transporter [Myxococcales bacterium]